MSLHDQRVARRARLLLVGLGGVCAGALVAGAVVAAGLMEGDAKPGTPGPERPRASASSPTAEEDEQRRKFLRRTPEIAGPIVLQKPIGQRDGLSTGFSHGPVGAISKAVHFWEEYAFLDDQKARQQLESIVSPDAEGYVDRLVSEVRRMREEVGLPPSGGLPPGITFVTQVNAVHATTVRGFSRGVLQIWLNWDRYGVRADGVPDDRPIKDEDVDFILKLEEDGWKLTDEPQYRKMRYFPVPYFPDEHESYADGWRQVRHAE